MSIYNEVLSKCNNNKEFYNNLNYYLEDNVNKKMCDAFIKKSF